MKLAYTRTANTETIHLAEQLGIELFECPLISVEHHAITNKTLAYFSNQSFDGWIVTSKNAAQFINNLLCHSGVQLPKYIYAVGNATAQLLSALPLEVILPDQHTAKHLADKIISRHQTGSFCFFRGNIALDIIPSELSSALDLSSFECYTTKLLPTKIDPSSFDAIAFFSPSAVEAYAASSQKQTQKPIFAVGPTTARAILQQLGINAVVAGRPDAETLLKTVKNYYDERN